MTKNKRLKKIVLLFTGVAMSSGTFAQTYFEDNFNEGIDGWTLVDSDDDGNNWRSLDFDGPQAAFANSRSYNLETGTTLNPDNWMISGAIDLSSATGTTYLRWLARAEQNGFPNDKYSVYAATSSDVASLEASAVTFTEVIGETGGEYVLRSLDVSSLNGESEVFIAFRHHDVTNQLGINIDDVNVKFVPEKDIKMVSISTNPVFDAGTVTIAGKVINNGTSAISSFDVDWNDGTSHNETFTVDLEPGATYDFTHSTTLTAENGNDYDLAICVTTADDGDASNNCINFMTSCVSEVVTKYVVGEEKTGTWCGFCPRGAVALEEMESQEKFIGIAVHSADPMAVAAYASGMEIEIPGGFPGGGVDRVIMGDPSDFEYLYNERSSHIPPATITVGYTEVGSAIEVKVTANFVASLRGDYRLAAMITEDHVTGTGDGYNQSNYYSGGASGPLTGYDTLPNPVPAADMVYDHVARAIGDNKIRGIKESLPTEIEAGSTHSYTYTIPKGEDWSIENLHFIGVLFNATTGDMLNAGKIKAEPVGINEIAEDRFNVSVYPNPATDNASVSIDLLNASNVSVEVYNTFGALVFSNSTKNLAKGKYVYTINTSDFSKGLYIVKATVNNVVKTTKLSVK